MATGDYVTAQGFRIKTNAEIVAELEAGYRSIYGIDYQVAPESPGGQEISSRAETLSDIWEMMQEVANLYDPSSVTGVLQDLSYGINGVVRKNAVPSVVVLELTGTPGASVSSGFQAKNNAGLTFSTDDEIELDIVTGIGTGSATCTVTGPNEAQAGTITEIATPVADVTSVTNPAAATPGRNRESNAEFRLRRALSVGKPGLNLLDSLYANLADIEGVSAVRVYQNRTNAIDINGLPPHSYMPVVLGGDDDEIAEVIWANMPLGIGAVGNTVVTVIDSNGEPNQIFFERPSIVDIYVDLLLDKTGTYPINGDDIVRESIIKYADGLLFAETGFAGFKIGLDILRSRMYTAVNLVQGHEVTQLRVGDTAWPLTDDNYDLAFNAASLFDEARIRINGSTPI